MKNCSARMLVFLLALCDTAAGAAATKPMTAQAWLAAVPPLPSTAEEAHAQWTDSGGTLKPGPAFERVSDGIRTQVTVLSRPTQGGGGGTRGSLSAPDQALVAQITVFPSAATVLQNIQATRAAQAALVQKWRAELNALEQHRLQERGALPACHNEAGAPSQLAIRDVERSYAQRKIAIAARYLAQFHGLVTQMKLAVAPRIEHGDAAMAAWAHLHDAGIKAQLAPLARGAATDALQDVGLVQNFIQDTSLLAARPVADRNALERVYAQAAGC
jgi:hypothetical protein